MHRQGMIHGDLKGVCFRILGLSFQFSRAFPVKANILINHAGQACLADFGLLVITSDLTGFTSSAGSFVGGGSYRWMSPELFDPDKFGLKNCHPTKNSDRYAFGMVIYEVLSGQPPFYGSHHYSVVL